ITRGQMALATNQRGYDVIGAENERISVKTVTSSSQVHFNTNTFELVDRVMVLRVNTDEENGVSVETLLDRPAAEFASEYEGAAGHLRFRTAQRPVRPLEHLAVATEASIEGMTIRQYENGSIAVLVD